MNDGGIKDLIIVAILVLIIGLAAAYVIRAKRRGVKCIGCKAGENCLGCAGKSSNGCNCHSN